MFDKPPARKASARPAPVQRRGVERVQAILEAAETLLREQGYEAATLKAISERTGIPLASMYHYFADRNHVDVELVRRHAERLDSRIADALEHATPGSLSRAVGGIVDILVGYCREFPDFVELWYFGRSPAIGEVVEAFDAELAERFWRYLLDRSFLDADTSQLAVELAFEAGSRLFDVAFRRSAGGDEPTIAELKRLVTAYLGTYAPQD
ncbi:TetR/AcrR family transcriptional regulator [Nocardia sp. NPDC050413]|uniref:TetR/AcrR family transcriptional regulator n=1 Tax=Nocardia sp. NPDC050413 TaxID=3155784 RepID=UPI0033D42238